MSEYTQYDLRRKAQRLYDLSRRHRSNIKLSPEEFAELECGIDAKEYEKIIDGIRGARRSATESKKTKAVEKKRSESFDHQDFLEEEIDLTGI